VITASPERGGRTVRRLNITGAILFVVSLIYGLCVMESYVLAGDPQDDQLLRIKEDCDPVLSFDCNAPGAINVKNLKPEKLTARNVTSACDPSFTADNWQHSSVEFDIRRLVADHAGSIDHIKVDLWTTTEGYQYVEFSRNGTYLGSYSSHVDGSFDLDEPGYSDYEDGHSTPLRLAAFVLTQSPVKEVFASAIQGCNVYYTKRPLDDTSYCKLCPHIISGISLIGEIAVMATCSRVRNVASGVACLASTAAWVTPVFFEDAAVRLCQQRACACTDVYCLQMECKKYEEGSFLGLFDSDYTDCQYDIVEGECTCKKEGVDGRVVMFTKRI
jgi:hypothetical protein